MKIVGYANPSGSAYWRLKFPFLEMRKKGIEAIVSKEGINKDALDWCDVIMLQSVVDKAGIALAYEYQQEKGKKIVLDLDDWIETNEDNPNRKEHEDFDAFFVIGQTLKIADLITVTTPYLAEKVKKYNKNVKVIPNYVPGEHFKLQEAKNETGELRIGYFGSITHKKDLELIEEPLKKAMIKYNAKFIQVCDPRLKENYEGLKMEFVWPVPFEWYPDRLKSLQIDFALAPLETNEFNRCKSWIKPLEGAVYAIPTISSILEPYMTLPASFTKVRDDEWESVISEFCENKDLRQSKGKQSQDFVKTVLLENHVDDWIKAFEL